MPSGSGGAGDGPEFPVPVSFPSIAVVQEQFLETLRSDGLPVEAALPQVLCPVPCALCPLCPVHCALFCVVRCALCVVPRV